MSDRVCSNRAIKPDAPVFSGQAGVRAIEAFGCANFLSWRFHRRLICRHLVLMILLSVALAGCYREGPGLLTPTPDFPSPPALTPLPIQIDGSALMQPLAARLAVAFQQASPGVRVIVGASGTRTGFARLCAGEFSLLNALRSIDAQEAALCRANGVALHEIPLAYQAIAVVVPVENAFAGCLNLTQLAGIWRAGSAMQSWRQVNLQFPDVPLAVYAPPDDSLAYNLFQERVLSGGATRPTYEGVPVGLDAVGFLELGEALRLQGSLRLLPLAFGDGVGAPCVMPDEAAVLNGSYAPLTRVLRVYAAVGALTQPEVAQFVRYLLSAEADVVIRDLGLIPLPVASRAQVLEQTGLLP